jgi:hypothetical protein
MLLTCGDVGLYAGLVGEYCGDADPGPSLATPTSGLKAAPPGANGDAVPSATGLLTNGVEAYGVAPPAPLLGSML